MFIFVIVFLNVIIMIFEPFQSIFNFKTQHSAPQMCRECRFLCRTSSLDSKNCRKANIRGSNIAGKYCKDITISVYWENFEIWARKLVANTDFCVAMLLLTARTLTNVLKSRKTCLGKFYLLQASVHITCVWELRPANRSRKPIFVSRYCFWLLKNRKLSCVTSCTWKALVHELFVIQLMYIKPRLYIKYSCFNSCTCNRGCT